MRFPSHDSNFEFLADREPRLAEHLQKAWHQKTNEEISASIIGFIRQAALGEPLVPFEERVEFALERLEQRHDWSGEQRKWLDRIGKTLVTNQQVPDPDNLEHGAFARSSPR